MWTRCTALNVTKGLMEPRENGGDDGDSTTTDTSAYSNTNILPPVKNNFNMTHTHTHTHTHHESAWMSAC
jgi:hypothetical protein